MDLLLALHFRHGREEGACGVVLDGGASDGRNLRGFHHFCAGVADGESESGYE